ncbi:MAG: Crp/Fnr family transcriptional regulator [Terriglobales bacterium]
MARSTRPSVTRTITPKPPPTDARGNQIHNELLIGLSAVDGVELLSKLEYVRLKVHSVLFEPGDSLKSVYFCNSGMISILTVFPDGKSVEVGLVGKEGFVGLPLLVGFQTSSTRAVSQLEATAFRVNGETLMALLPRCPELGRQLQQYSEICSMQITQIAACNRLHEVHERLARWLLMCSDRVSSNHLALTQELLGQMLGTRRSSVTVSAGILQKAGIITTGRGFVKIVDRKKLEEAACECYGIMQRQASEWRTGS